MSAAHAQRLATPGLRKKRGSLLTALGPRDESFAPLGGTARNTSACDPSRPRRSTPEGPTSAARRERQGPASPSPKDAGLHLRLLQATHRRHRANDARCTRPESRCSRASSRGSARARDAARRPQNSSGPMASGRSPRPKGGDPNTKAIRLTLTAGEWRELPPARGAGCNEHAEGGQRDRAAGTRSQARPRRRLMAAVVRWPRRLR